MFETIWQPWWNISLFFKLAGTRFWPQEIEVTLIPRRVLVPLRTNCVLNGTALMGHQLDELGEIRLGQLMN